jgi:hypothetical protein
MSHWVVHKRWCKSAAVHQELDCRAFRLALGLGRRGRTGLNNLGNTCFLSSGLQCLSHVAPLTGYLLSGAYRCDLNRGSRDGTGGVLVEKYELLLRDLCFGERSAVSPFAVKVAIGRKEPQFSGLQQQDAHEFLERFLDWLQEDVNRVAVKPYCERPESDGSDDTVLAAESWAKDKARNNSIVNELFGGQLRSQLECDRCNKKLVRFDYFHTMQLALPHAAPREQIVRVLFFETASEADQLGRRPVELEVRLARGARVDELRRRVAVLTRSPQVLDPDEKELLLFELSEHMKPQHSFSLERRVEDTSLVIDLGRTLAAYILPKGKTPLLLIQVCLSSHSPMDSVDFDRLALLRTWPMNMALRPSVIRCCWRWTRSYPAPGCASNYGCRYDAV